ncbi:MAG: DNA replication/repair protein RecF [Candidatus Merdivicinus sp.]|jgi:DNA replication and repair protein RecF
MIVEEICLQNFRNIAAAELAPCPEINILLGDNAQGKTNFMEAIWLCTGNRSFRGARESQMVRFGEAAFQIRNQFRDRERQQEIRYAGGEKKRKVQLNNVPLKTPSELAGIFPAVVFDPTEMNIVREGPGERRRFLDTAASQLKPAYGQYLAQYQSVLEQRNALLRDGEKYAQFADTFDIWDLQLARLGTILSIYRADYLRKLTPAAAEIYGGFTGYAESFTAGYESTVFPEEMPLEVYSDELIEYYLEALRQSRETDLRMRCTTKGIHRDDIALAVDGNPVKLYGSRGQQRSCAIALKLGEAHLYRRITGEAPVILLDDVMSELDQNRQDYIRNQIRGFQVLITCCDLSNTLRMESGKIFSVENGSIVLEP